jgi:hypothetical protein
MPQAVRVWLSPRGGGAGRRSVGFWCESLPRRPASLPLPLSSVLGLGLPLLFALGRLSVRFAMHVPRGACVMCDVDHAMQSGIITHYILRTGSALFSVFGSLYISAFCFPHHSCRPSGPETPYVVPSHRRQKTTASNQQVAPDRQCTCVPSVAARQQGASALDTGLASAQISEKNGGV